MRKALVFVASFALVLVAGAAVALMGTPAEPAASATTGTQSPGFEIKSTKDGAHVDVKEFVDEGTST